MTDAGRRALRERDRDKEIGKRQAALSGRAAVESRDGDRQARLRKPVVWGHDLGGSLAP